LMNHLFLYKIKVFLKYSRLLNLRGVRNPRVTFSVGKLVVSCYTTNMKDAEKTVGNMIDKAKVSFIGSIDEDGFPNMKAMLRPRKRNGIKEFWFTTNTSSMRTEQYRKNPHACIYFYDRKMFYHGVMLVGTMEVLEDAATKEMIWKFGDTMYYKKGVTDPDYCVLKFTATKGRYYHSFKTENFEVSE